MDIRDQEKVMAQALFQEFYTSELEDKHEKKEVYRLVAAGIHHLDIKEAAIDSIRLSIENWENFKKKLIQDGKDYSMIDNLIAEHRKALENTIKIGEKQ